MKARIKEVRQSISIVAQNIINVQDIIDDTDHDLVGETGFDHAAVSKLSVAFSWCGRSLRYLSEPSPYVKTTDVNSFNIDAIDAVILLQDHPDKKIDALHEIEFYKKAALLIQEIVYEVESLMRTMNNYPLYQLCLQNAWTNLYEAKSFVRLQLHELKTEGLPEEIKELIQDKLVAYRAEISDKNAYIAEIQSKREKIDHPQKDVAMDVATVKSTMTEIDSLNKQEKAFNERIEEIMVQIKKGETALNNG